MMQANFEFRSGDRQIKQTRDILRKSRASGSAGDRSEEWNVVTNILNNTSTTTVPERRGMQRFKPFSKLTNYGTMIIKGNDNIPQKKPAPNSLHNR